VGEQEFSGKGITKNVRKIQGALKVPGFSKHWAFPEKIRTPPVEDIDFSRFRTPWISSLKRKTPWISSPWILQTPWMSKYI